MLFALLLTWAITTDASAGGNRAVILVVDTSGSMADGDRLTQAKAALTASLDALPANDLAGLHRYAGECGDGGDLLVPVGIGNRDQMRAAIVDLVAAGGTPTPDALRLAVGEFPATATEGVIVLVSDGGSTCGDPCPVVRELLFNSRVKFKAHTVGFHASGAAEEELACIAQATGAKYVAATDTPGLQTAVSAALTEDQRNNALPFLVVAVPLVAIAAVAAAEHVRRARRPYIKTRLAGPSLVLVEWARRDDNH